MMTFKNLARYIGAEPFRPFRIKMNSGDNYDIRHPEMIQAGRTTSTIFTWMNDDQDPEEQMREISNLLIGSIEFLDTTARKS